MTIYVPHENVLPGARAINVTNGQTLNGVVRIDTEQCTVEAFVYPLRVVDGEVVTCTMRFSHIEVVREWRFASFIPVKFNCHE